MKWIVSPDGSGDFVSLQAAADAAAECTDDSAVIVLRPGIYRERVVLHRDGLRLLGEDRERCVISASGCAKDRDGNGKERGTFCSATLLVSGRNVTVENLTVRNDAGDGRAVGQAIALYAAGDGGVYRNLDLLAHQDTLFCGPVNPQVADFISPRQGSAEFSDTDNLGNSPVTRSREFFENCFIRGDVDFIFGPYRCWFEGCTLFMNERGGWYTAANTAESQPLGFVFHRCVLTGECAEGAGFLGRPWRRFARTVFLRCEMDSHVSPQGFADWDAERVVTSRLGEYETTGAGALCAARHPDQRKLTDAEAANILAERDEFRK